MTTAIKTVKAKFMHDEIHNSNFPKVETILDVRADLNLFELFDVLRKHKATEGQTSIDIFQVFIEQDNEWVKINHEYNRGVKREPLNTDKLYIYQMAKNPSSGDPLANQWICCTQIKDWDTPEANQRHKEFYTDHFAKNYHNGDKKGQDDAKVVVVKGQFGNVAGRDARDIREDDIIERYNF